MTNDRTITISAGSSRRATSWTSQTMLLSELWARLQAPVRGTETMAEYLSMKKPQQDDLKDVGGFVAGTAYMMQMPLFIIIVGLIYVAEVLSVMIQVTYFKKTGGKRFFKMAPIHHHFELCGWSETQVVAVFSIATAVLCLIALMGV